ncbi:hypothetical protein DEJ24_06075 [Curtobacterium sp. MCPF17_001]|nr:hypothetical protein DEJ24_06075 [Curtobacterium sp. MCPF17_001]
MQPDGPRLPASSIGPGGKVTLLAWFMSALLVSSAPLVIGVATVALVPGLGGLRAGVTPLVVVGWLMAAVALAVGVGAPLERVARRLVGGPQWAGSLAAEAASLGFLWLLMVPMTASGLSALLASSISVVLYKSFEPLIESWGARDRAVDEG